MDEQRITLSGTPDPATRRRRAAGTTVVFAILVLARVPFFFTHHVQEDAYISWRCARNLAATGHYAYNVPEHVSASSSHTYVLLTAGLCRVFADNFIPAILTLNTVMFVGAIYLIAGAVFADRGRRLLLWTSLCLVPVSLVTSYAGMETSLLLLLVAVALRCNAGAAGGDSSRAGPAMAAAALFLMPWTRLDAVAYGGRLILYLAARRHRVPWLACIALAAGVVTLALFNRLYFGTVLPQTAIAKSLAHHSHSPAAVAHRLLQVFFGNGSDGGIYALIGTRYLARAGPTVALLFLAAFASACLVARREPGRSATADVGYAALGDRKLFALLVSIAVLIPVAYAIGGVLFPWYLWPAAVMGYGIVLALFIGWLAARGRRARVAGVSALFASLTLLGVGQWCLARNWGTQEFCYRASIGRALAARVAPSDDLFLEPAGYIPFFAGCYATDQVGLVSPKVTDYRRRFGPEWCLEFLRRERPAYFIQRRPFYTDSVFDVGGSLSPDQRVWFDAHYQRVMKFDYDPAAYHTSPLALRICRMGSAVGYDVYHARPPHSSSSPRAAAGALPLIHRDSFSHSRSAARDPSPSHSHRHRGR